MIAEKGSFSRSAGTGGNCLDEQKNLLSRNNPEQEV
jgi:hypothetical protein